MKRKSATKEKGLKTMYASYCLRIYAAHAVLFNYNYWYALRDEFNFKRLF